MTHFDIAMQRDINRDIVQASAEYESCIEFDGLLDGFCNLAFLYWQCTEYGFNVGFNLSKSFILVAAERYSQVLARGLQRFPNSCELKFWKAYFEYDTIGVSFSRQDCEYILATSDRSLVPFFFLYTVTSGTEYAAEAEQLTEQCKLFPTIKHAYIMSIIKATQHHAKLGPFRGDRRGS